MNPLEYYSLEQLKARTSEKWRNYDSDVLPLWVAEMDVKLPDPLVNFLTKTIEIGDVGYLSNSNFERYVKSFTDFTARHWHWEQPWDVIADVEDVVSGCRRVIDAWLEHDSNNSVIVSTPVYPPFINKYTRGYTYVDVPLTCSTSANVTPTGSDRVVENWLTIPDSHSQARSESGPLEPNLSPPHPKDGIASDKKLSEPYRPDFEKLEVAFGAATADDKRAVYALCNPANPSGSAFTEEELSQLAKLANQYGVLVVSDEIHGPLVTERNFEHSGHHLNECPNPANHGRHSAFVPYLSVPEAGFAVAVTSASKAFSIPGMKAALVVPSTDSRAIDLINNSGHFGKATSEHIGALAQTTCFEECDDWLFHLVQAIRNNLAYFETLLKQYFPLAKYIKPQGTYFAWVDFSAYFDPEVHARYLDATVPELALTTEPSKYFLQQAKVALNPGRTFALQQHLKWNGMPLDETVQDIKTPYDYFVRINLATSQEIIRQALERMAESLV
ncbi:putative cystathionine beta-lyase [Actinomycetota bacterium]|nr:putative cystathionine beta-lyase [Actinomycetota bacterium]